MKRALVTLGHGDEYQRLLQIALSSFRDFSLVHGYDLLIASPPASDRACSWWKVPALQTALKAYDEVLWVDADMVIVDPSEDLNVPEDSWQALVRHRTGDGDVPNCGLWFVRKPMLPWLERVWAKASRLDHGWWEQAALMDLMGFTVDQRPTSLVNPSTLYKRTHWLDNGWNWHCWDTPGPEHVRVAHATMLPNRELEMQAWADGCFPSAAPECRHRYPMNPGCVCAPYFAEQMAS